VACALFVHLGACLYRILKIAGFLCGPAKDCTGIMLVPIVNNYVMDPNHQNVFGCCPCMEQDTFIVTNGIALLLTHDVLLELVYLKYNHNHNSIDARGKNLTLLILLNHIANT
jgi:hypothetical protein